MGEHYTCPYCGLGHRESTVETYNKDINQVDLNLIYSCGTKIMLSRNKLNWKKVSEDIRCKPFIKSDPPGRDRRG